MLQQSDPQYSKLRGAQAQSFAENLTMETATRMLNREVMNRLKSIATGKADLPPEADSGPEAESEAPVARRIRLRKHQSRRISRLKNL